MVDVLVTFHSIASRATPQGLPLRATKVMTLFIFLGQSARPAIPWAEVKIYVYSRAVKAHEIHSLSDRVFITIVSHVEQRSSRTTWLFTKKCLFIGQYCLRILE